MSQQELIQTKLLDNICIISLNNPEKRNVLTVGMLNEITSLLKHLTEEDITRCIIIKGEGDKAFSSGYDISAIKNDDMMREFGTGHPLEDCFNAIESFPYPVIAMINGHVFGAGLELAVTCDIRICADHVKIGMPPAKLGVVYSYSGTKKFLNLIGTANSRELFLTGNYINADRAKKMGLVNHTVDSLKLYQFTMEMAEDISENAPLSLKTMKQMFNIWQRNQTICQEDEELIKSYFKDVQESDDYKEGQKAFKEKRKPLFKGK
jgi:enoyl-CoA hydratase/carnithine racemase